MADEKPKAKPTDAPLRSVLHWRDAKGTAATIFAGAVARHRWEVSPQVTPTEITEAAFDEAVRSVAFDRL